MLQFRKLGKALKYMVHNEEDGVGEVTSFGAVSYTHLTAIIKENEEKYWNEQ